MTLTWCQTMTILYVDHFYFNIKHMRGCFYHKEINTLFIAYVTNGKQIWTKVSTGSIIIGAYVSGKYHIYFLCFCIFIWLVHSFLHSLVCLVFRMCLRSIIYFSHIVFQIWICNYTFITQNGRQETKVF